MHSNTVIAIDGYSSCGKSTFAKAIAQQLGYLYIDSGAMYRAITYYAIDRNLISDSKLLINTIVDHNDQIRIEFKLNTIGKPEIFLNDKNIENKIRTLEVASKVSPVSTIKEVREFLVGLQRSYALKSNVVMDGRDIGTVVFPKAQIKIFMTADPQVRAQRRFDELSAMGEKVDFEEILNNVISRDKIDTTRQESPLRQAPDALLLDNSYLTPKEQMDWFTGIYNQYKNTCK